MDLGGGGSNVTNVKVVTPDMEYSSGQVMAIAINSKFSCGYMWTREEAAASAMCYAIHHSLSASVKKRISINMLVCFLFLVCMCYSFSRLFAKAFRVVGSV